VVAGGLFVALGQAFPLYLRLTGGVNRYGAAFGLLTLLLAWFAVLAHLLLFGCYVNVTYRRRRGSWPLREPGPDPSGATGRHPHRTRSTVPERTGGQRCAIARGHAGRSGVRRPAGRGRQVRRGHIGSV
jgi:uncharacterized BrkB/YihY/UPF0761 family membrane protein